MALPDPAPARDVPAALLALLTDPAAVPDGVTGPLLDALRPGVLDRTRDAWAALASDGQALPTALVHRLAAEVAAAQGAPLLAAHHTALAGDDDPAPGITAEVQDALVAHARVLAVSPALSTAEDLDELRALGVDVPRIVLVAQTAAFGSYLARLHLVLSVLAGATGTGDGPAAATRARGRGLDRPDATRAGSPRPTAFTRDQLAWEPWVPAPTVEELTAEQTASFARKATTNSVYFRLISLTPALTAARSDIDNAIFLPRDGATPKAERELAAAATSKVTDCIYCASVHARKAAALSRREEDVDRLLAVEPDRDEDHAPLDPASLGAGQDERWAAIVEASAALALARPALGADHVERLRDRGLDTAGVLDVLTAAAFFAWANRLMLSLGEPAVPAPAA